MILLLDNIINNYSNIISLISIYYIFNLNKKNLFLLFLLDILLNGFPIITTLILILYYINTIIFKKLSLNKLTKFLIYILYMFIFLTFYYAFNNNISYIYYIKINIETIIFNTIIYLLYIIFDNYQKVI